MSLVTVVEDSRQNPPAPYQPASTSTAALEAALAELDRRQHEWAELPLRDRRAILQEMRKDFARIAQAWAEACCHAEGILKESDAAAEEWLAGPYLILRNLRLLDEALGDIDEIGRPRLPGPVRTQPSGRVVARIFPQSAYDRLFYPGVTANAWMDFGFKPHDLPKTQAVAYHQNPRPRGVCLVLGGGNVSSIGPMDILYKLFVDNQVVICKMHPVNAYLGPLLEEGFRALVDWGFLRIVYGGGEVGQYLCEHDKVSAIHITGSDKTVEAIAFGTGEEGARRQRERRPKLEKPISSELGNVSPVIVVPGPWSEDDLVYQGENIASMLANNAGFNCNAARLLITQAGWKEGKRLLHEVRNAFAVIPTRRAYYPGAADRYAEFLKAHPDADEIGEAKKGELPWLFIPEVDPEAAAEITFRQEAFCSAMAQTALEAGSPAEFLAKAVDFANQKVWGTLNVTLLVHPKSLEDGTTARAYAKALEDLRYGTIAVNVWAAAGYGLVVTPWGAHPGHDLYEIGSGTGFVHNTLMFDKVRKTVIEAPFHMRPKPIWFPSHQKALALAKRITEFEAEPSPAKLPGIFWEALRG